MLRKPDVAPLTPEEERDHLIEDYAALLNDRTEKWRVEEHDKRSPYPFPERAWSQRTDADKEWFRVIARFCMTDVDATRAALAKAEARTISDCNALNQLIDKVLAERDAALARVAALTAEVEAWREAFDWQYTEKYRLMLDKARRLRAQNEEADRGR